MSATGSNNSPSEARGSARVRIATGTEVILDARRALFLPDWGVLVITDLHLGYAWIQRRRGTLFPVSTPDSTPTRLAHLLSTYQPRQLVFLGDLVHQAIPIPALEQELQALISIIPKTVSWSLCRGNHDRQLPGLLESMGLSVDLRDEMRLGMFRLHHGDQWPSGDPDSFTLESAPLVDVIGHEHPALRLGDGVATQAKVPCFVMGDRTWILPAFSDWAAGSDVSRGRFLGPVARQGRFHTAYACLGSRLLRMPLNPQPA